MTNMKTAEGKFIQVGPDGVISEGDFALKRPGRVYFDYDEPTPLRIIADGFWVAVENYDIKSTDRYPLSETPLSILLAEKPDFTGSDYKITFEEHADHYKVHASDPNAPKQGTISLVFTNNPIAIKSWVTTDAQGLKTVITLQNVRLNVPVASKLFYIENNIPSRKTY
ncbi:MAG: outer-membrane lipoprotein carrier protein LolA [Pseudomonadota bacterium]